jgi:hypothetical protein
MLQSYAMMRYAAELSYARMSYDAAVIMMNYQGNTVHTLIPTYTAKLPEPSAK